MNASFPEPLDKQRVKVYPLAQRKTLSRLEDILVNPSEPAPVLDSGLEGELQDCVSRVRAARAAGASVILMYGAHLIKNGLMAVVNELIRSGWVTHLATNGAGVIHDWELAFMGKTEESVRENVVTGSFGTWDETGRAMNLSVLTGGAMGEGFGRSVGRLIAEDALDLPSPETLEKEIAGNPSDPRTGARADLLHVMRTHQLKPGINRVSHPHKETSIAACAYSNKVPLTVHPGICYDIYATHPMFNGAAIGRAAEADFSLLCRSVEGLENGVLLSVGSAIMAPQVFEKSLSVVNNLRLQDGRQIVSGHSMYIVDIQDGGNWDWDQGEPPKTNPAYYLRFCKTFARMNGRMRYVQCDNRSYLHALLHRLQKKAGRAGE